MHSPGWWENPSWWSAIAAGLSLLVTVFLWRVTAGQKAISDRQKEIAQQQTDLIVKQLEQTGSQSVVEALMQVEDILRAHPTIAPYFRRIPGEVPGYSQPQPTAGQIQATANQILTVMSLLVSYLDSDPGNARRSSWVSSVCRRWFAESETLCVVFLDTVSEYPESGEFLRSRLREAATAASQEQREGATNFRSILERANG